jgi:hypothetical protein
VLISCRFITCLSGLLGTDWSCSITLFKVGCGSAATPATKFAGLLQFGESRPHTKRRQPHRGPPQPQGASAGDAHSPPGTPQFRTASAACLDPVRLPVPEQAPAARPLITSPGVRLLGIADFVGTLPSRFHLARRPHPVLEGTLAGNALEFASPTGILPGAINRGL